MIEYNEVEPEFELRTRYKTYITPSKERSIKKEHSPEFKVMVAIKAIKEEKTISQIVTKYSIYPQQVRD